MVLLLMILFKILTKKKKIECNTQDIICLSSRVVV
jgi:hypothetical protein